MTTEPRAITIVIAEDQEMVRAALVSLIEEEPDLTVVGECGRGDDAVRLVAATRPDVAVLDIDMPGLDGVEACAAISATSTGCGCMVLTALNKPGLLQRALQAGARGFVVKYAPTQELLDGIRTVAAGRRAIDPSLAVAALGSRDLGVTQRELDVVMLVAEGAPDQEIARRLHLSSGTVRNYISAVMAKVDARNRVDLVRIGIRDGWLLVGQYRRTE